MVELCYIQAGKLSVSIIEMAALGLGVDLRIIGRLGGRITLAVTGSLIVLFGVGLLLVRLLHISGLFRPQARAAADRRGAPAVRIGISTRPQK
jgi:hypothetical protein